MDHAAMPRHLHDRLIHLLESTSDFVATCNPERRVEWINVAGRRLVGMAEQTDPAGALAEDFLPPACRHRWAAEVLPALHAEGIWLGECELLHRDGSSIPVSKMVVSHRDTNGALVGFSTICREITALKQAEEALRASHERYLAVIRATNDAAYDWDLRAGRLQFFENFASLFAFRPDEVEHNLEWWTERVHADDRAEVEQSLLASMGAGHGQWQAEYRFRRGDGRWAHVLDRGTWFRDGDGKALRMIGAMADITERKEMQARLLLADRMAALGTLAAGVAHEINNPLAYVISNLDFVRGAMGRLASGADRETRNSALREALLLLDEVSDGAERVRAIVGDLRLFSRPESDHREPVDPCEALEKAVAMAQHELRHRVQLTRELGPVPMVEASGSRLGQVFLNLLINAAHAIPEDGSTGHEIRMRTATTADGWALVEVSDTGNGIPEEIRNRIFEPFFTTKGPGSGTGLGLSICHQLVTALGGRIEVESEAGKGSCFRVLLPPAAHAAKHAAPQPPGQPAPQQHAAGGPATTRGNVLLVDDDAMVGRAIRRMISAQHDVTFCPSAAEALAALDGGASFDAILSDVMMPGMSGIQFHQALQARNPALADRVIFLTGGAFTAGARDYLRRVPNPCLEKPFRPDELLALLASRIGS